MRKIAAALALLACVTGISAMALANSTGTVTFSAKVANYAELRQVAGQTQASPWTASASLGQIIPGHQGDGAASYETPVLFWFATNCPANLVFTLRPFAADSDPSILLSTGVWLKTSAGKPLANTQYHAWLSSYEGWNDEGATSVLVSHTATNSIVQARGEKQYELVVNGFVGDVDDQPSGDYSAIVTLTVGAPVV